MQWYLKYTFEMHRQWGTVHLCSFCALLHEGERVEIRATTKKGKLGQRKINKVNHTFTQNKGSDNLKDIYFIIFKKFYLLIDFRESERHRFVAPLTYAFIG